MAHDVARAAGVFVEMKEGHHAGDERRGRAGRRERADKRSVVGSSGRAAACTRATSRAGKIADAALASCSIGRVGESAPPQDHAALEPAPNQPMRTLNWKTDTRTRPLAWACSRVGQPGVPGRRQRVGIARSQTGGRLRDDGDLPVPRAELFAAGSSMPSASSPSIVMPSSTCHYSSTARHGGKLSLRTRRTPRRCTHPLELHVPHSSLDLVSVNLGPLSPTEGDPYAPGGPVGGGRRAERLGRFHPPGRLG